ncbi:MAG: hypothetical protein ABEH56_02345 [Salinirussus sp.]
MGKISIGLRGWRFDEEVVFDDDGDLRAFGEMPEDARYRLIRLSALLGEPCDACWLVHGEAEIEACNPAEIVYGEPLAEVVLCAEHEPDFLYWFRELGGDAYAGGATLQDEFHEWFASGNRAPDGYEGIDHVDRAPETLPAGVEAADAKRTGSGSGSSPDDAGRAAVDLELDDLDV